LRTNEIRTLSLAAALCLCAAAAEAQHKSATDSITTRSAVRRGAGRDENIRKDEAVNSTTPAASRTPAVKDGEKTCGAMCARLHIDNRTGWNIRIYVDGDYAGMVGPFGDVYGYYGCDEHRLYAVARFSDGSERTWGPARVNTCGEKAWTLLE
jgi:hypothetical protein